MLPIHCFQAFRGPFIARARGQVLPRDLLASVKPDMWGDVTRNFVAPNDQGNVLSRQELRWTVMIAVSDSSGDRPFHKSVAHAVDLLDECKLLPLQHAVHMSVHMDIVKSAAK